MENSMPTTATPDKGLAPPQPSTSGVSEGRLPAQPDRALRDLLSSNEIPFTVAGKVTRGMIEELALESTAGFSKVMGAARVAQALKDLDWQDLGGIPRPNVGAWDMKDVRFSDRHDVYPSRPAENLILGPTRALQEIASLESSDALHLRVPVGFIALEIAEAFPYASSGHRGGFFGFGRKNIETAPPPINARVSIFAPHDRSAKGSEQQRVDSRRFAVAISFQLSGEGAVELRRILNEPQTAEAQLLALLSSPPNSQIGQAIQWVRDGMLGKGRSAEEFSARVQRDFVGGMADDATLFRRYRDRVQSRLTSPLEE